MSSELVVKMCDDIEATLPAEAKAMKADDAGDSQCSFDKDIPYASVMQIIGMGRGTIPANYAKGMQHLGCILGAAGAIMDTDSGPVFADDAQPAGFLSPAVLLQLIQIVWSLFGK
jgi:hypothetical protein